MKVRSDFVTNSSSSSFIVLDINSPTFADIIRKFKDEIEEQGYFQINELDGSNVSIFGDEVYGETPCNFVDLVPTLARIFYEEVYIPGEYCDEEEEEEAREEFEASIEDMDDDCGYGLEILIAKEIVANREKIEADIQYAEIRCGNVGWGGDDDSRYEKENYDEEYLKDIYETIAENNGCSVEEVTDDDFYYYVGGCISNSEDVYTYDKTTGKEEHSKSYTLD